MNSFPTIQFCACVILAVVVVVPRASGDQIATSKFNSPPFTVGITVDGQGGVEPGWAAPWLKLGGFSERGHVVSSPKQEGNAAVQIFADVVFGTSVEREWFNIVPVVRVDAHVFVTPGARMDGQIVTATPASGEIDPRRAGTWRIAGNGLIEVFDATKNGYVSTGMHTLPNQWNKYSLFVNTNTNTYAFLFNNQLYFAPQGLPFMNEMFYVDGINLRALGTLTSYVDNVTVTAITPLRGDFNPDSHVDAADVAAMVRALANLNGYKTQYGFNDTDVRTIGDINSDGIVTNADLQSLLTLLQTGGGSVTAVPEPATATLMLLAMTFGAIAYRRRQIALRC